MHRKRFILCPNHVSLLGSLAPGRLSANNVTFRDISFLLSFNCLRNSRHFRYFFFVFNFRFKRMFKARINKLLNGRSCLELEQTCVPHRLREDEKKKIKHLQIITKMYFQQKFITFLELGRVKWRRRERKLQNLSL